MKKNHRVTEKVTAEKISPSEHYYTDFFQKQNLKISLEKFLFYFKHFAQNIHCVYMLEPPRRGGSNE